MTIGVTLRVFGGPLPALVQADGLDERTVAKWRERAGTHSQGVPEARVMQGQLDLGQVQADAMRIKGRGFIAWVGMAWMIATRVWLGGVVSLQRDRCLADRLMACVRPFRSQVAHLPGERGRCHLPVWPELAIAQVIRHTTAGFTLTRRIYDGATQ